MRLQYTILYIIILMSKIKANAKEIFNQAYSLCYRSKDVQKQQAMVAYMKNQFAFWGINQPARNIIFRELKQAFSLDWDQNTKNLILLLWEADQREMQYLAMDIMKTLLKKMTINDLDFVEQLILDKPWWDTVDFLASTAIGHIMTQNDNQNEYAFSRIQHKNMWLQRTALLFQLKYKSKTDWDLLQSLILMTEHSTEFFIRKAQGWALREYSKTHPAEVRIFVENNPQLSGLTKREGLKYC